MKSKAKKADSKTPQGAAEGEIAAPNDEQQDAAEYARFLRNVAQCIWEAGAGSCRIGDDPVREALFDVLLHQSSKIDVSFETQVETSARLVFPAFDFIKAELHSISIVAYMVLIEQAVEFAPQRALKRADMPYKDFVPVRQHLRKRAEDFLNRWFDYLTEKTEAETRDAFHSIHSSGCIDCLI
jgi:hypothetical protein